MAWTAASEASSGASGANHYRALATNSQSGVVYAQNMNGQSESTMFTFSAWYNLDDFDDADNYIFSTRRDPGLSFALGFPSGGLFINSVVGVPFSDVLFGIPSGQGGPGVFQTEGWHHIAYSLDTRDATKRHAYLDGVDLETLGGSWEKYTIGALLHTAPGGSDAQDGWAIGGVTDQVSGSAYFHGSMSELWIAPGQYIDLAANPYVFRDADGLPVDLGKSGEAPTGIPPVIYRRRDASVPLENSGNGGTFDGIFYPAQAPGIGPTIDVPGPTPSGTVVNEASPGWTTAREGRAKAPYQAVSFSSTGLSTGGTLTGAVDHTTFTTSFWLRLNDLSARQVIYNTFGTAPGTPFQSGSYVEYLGENFENHIALSGTVSGTGATAVSVRVLVPDTDWHHYQATISTENLDDCQFYRDGVIATLLSNVFHPDELVGLGSMLDHYIGQNRTAGEFLNGDLSDFWFDIGDHSSTWTKRMKFYHDGWVPLGADGGNPTGSPPLIYLSGESDTFAANKGTGGGFSLVSGALTTVTTSTSQPVSIPEATPGWTIAT